MKVGTKVRVKESTTITPNDNNKIPSFYIGKVGIIVEILDSENSIYPQYDCLVSFVEHDRVAFAKKELESEEELLFGNNIRKTYRSIRNLINDFRRKTKWN